MTVLDPARPATAVTALAMAVTLGACSTEDAEQPTERSTSPTAQASPTRTPMPDNETDDPDQTPPEVGMQIRITIGGQRFTATLDDSPAASDLLAQLPVTVDMVDHGGVEKTGPLPGPLSLEGQPEGADPDVGDLGYYAPGNDLVLYHGDQSYFPGIVVLGRLDGDAAERIAALEGPVTATVAAG
ncbi:MAG TPA: cyclophilin-like fold protein [Nocardioides sp.]|nr:cyclophilin-like fold protein [Nocardioides sp.]